MSEEADTLHTGREVASQLGLGDAMARRYDQTYEEVTGETILTHRRDGRLFTTEQLGTARAIVQQTDIDVASAIRQALEQPVSLAEITLPLKGWRPQYRTACRGDHSDTAGGKQTLTRGAPRY